ncbi:unnamed protein product [Phyllotreta striolata]|uniref:CHK kinase-like domain-containing protein n=1 Tax=Phyllotreta striolata TaxID=444603 RepID=A0A9N9THC0_PHYSR|nr:unnamed protein product [Phyllotreta striolata]
MDEKESVESQTMDEKENVESQSLDEKKNVESQSFDEKEREVMEFLQKKLCSDGKELTESHVTNLTAPGENYWSDMLKIDLVLRDISTGNLEDLHLCAKCVTTHEDFMGDMTARVFQTEIDFYKTVLPAMQSFLKKRGLQELEFFPRVVCERLNLQETGDSPDSHALLILENLKSKGYTNLDRHTGFDFDTAKLVLRDLAMFHAVPLAMRLLEPEEFREKIAPRIELWDGPPKPKDGEPQQKFPEPHGLFRQILQQDVFCRSHMDVLEKFLQKDKKKFADGHPPKQYEGVFATLCHHDMWLNNTMQKLEDGKVVGNKLVDFQMYKVDNPIGDLLFLLTTSVDVPTLQNHFDYLLGYYHEVFVRTLEALGVDVKPFAYDRFLVALKECTSESFIQIIFMSVFIIFAKKGEKSNVMKMNDKLIADVHPVAKAKVQFLYSEIVKRNWYD